MHIFAASALALPLVAALPPGAPIEARQTNAAPFKADLRVDANRDGVVDVNGTTDIQDKQTWNETYGAIFLPNIGRTRASCHERVECNDASSKEQWAPENMATMRTVAMVNLSDTAVGSISIQNAAARSKVRIFLDSPELSENPPPLSIEDLANGSGSGEIDVKNLRYAYLENDTKIPAAKLREGLTLGIDSKQTRRVDWDGKVTVEFKVTDRGSTSTDKVILRVAPVLAHHHLQPIETMFTTKRQQQGDGKVAQDRATIQTIEDGIKKSMQKAGIKNQLKHFEIDTAWAQDVLEPGYATMPGPKGPISIRINVYGTSVIDGINDLTEILLFEKLRQEGVGAIQPSDLNLVKQGTLEAGGNIETIPPYEHNGKKFPAGRMVMGGTESGKPEVLKFFKAQEAQDPILLDSTWLYVKHVDEIVSFLPAKTKRGWRISIVDPRMGLEALKKLKADGHGEVKLTSHPTMQNQTDVPTVNKFLEDKQTQDAASHSAKIMQKNLEILKTETGITDDDIVRVPAVMASMTKLKEYLHTRDHDGGTKGGKGGNLLPLNSAFPSQVNGVPLSDSLFMAPKPWGPVVNGEDVLQKLSADAYSKAGFQVDFIDDWELHRGSGDLHCFTNTYRSMVTK
ncbi:hypothetical protein QQS21_005520 [Conoideocrella luteorostrata]|uniref:Protein-arginine deiminase C-terminal domain-containing protein n=1 Tax=Conoideocrella luteorostrata TaxID=1105319 RepID=A0AAJ0CTN0_9HYPO|nr:hypothetical protein QQS21_005520 [Conoideocrella luteorostrata]